jgi:hypothetical protein
MRTTYFALVFISIFLVRDVNAQTYWHYVMDTCTVNTGISSVFQKNNDTFLSLIEEATPSVLKICKVNSDLSMSIEQSIPLLGYNYALGGNGLNQINGGYLFQVEGTAYDLIKLDDNFNLVWHKNLQSLSSNPESGLPGVFCSDSNSNDIFAAGVYETYTSEFQCLSRQLRIFRLNESGDVLNIYSYPQLFMTAGIGCNYESCLPSSIRIQNNKIEIVGTALQSLVLGSQLYRNLNFIATFEFDGSLSSIEFLGENNGMGGVRTNGDSYLNYRQEFLVENNTNLSKLKIFKKENSLSPNNMIFENSEVWDYPNTFIRGATLTNDGLVVGTASVNQNAPTYTLHKYNNALQTIEWTKSYTVNLQLQNPGDSLLVSNSGAQNLTVMNDGGYVFTGTLSYMDEIYPWIIRTDACGDEVYNGCTISGVSELVESTSLKLFPNPAVNDINIQLPTTDTWIVRVFNSNGQLVSTEKINQSNFIQLNIQNMNTGLYTVQAMNSDGIVYSEMVMKE